MVGDDLLHAGAADVEAGSEELIEALSGGVGGDGECGRRRGGHVYEAWNYEARIGYPPSPPSLAKILDLL